MTQASLVVTPISLTSTDPVGNLANLLGYPNGQKCFVPSANAGAGAWFTYFMTSVAAPNGSTIIGGTGGGNWLIDASSAGVDSSGNITPATLTWPAGTASPTITEATQTSDAATNSMSLTPQAAFATATGTNRTPGSLIVKLAAPTNGGTVEAIFQVQRAGGAQSSLGNVPGSTTASALWLGAVVPANNNYAIQVDTGSGQITVGSTVGILSLNPSGTAVLVMTAAGLFCQKPIQGNSGIPFVFGRSSVTLASTGTTALSAAQQGTPKLIAASVSLTGNITIDFGGITGQYWLNLTVVTLAGHTVTVKNGAGTLDVTTLTTNAGATGFLLIDCDTAATIYAK